MEQGIPDDAFSKIPKVLWEASRMGMAGKDFFIMGIKNGQNIAMQLLTPAHAKEVMQQLQWHLEEYEKEHGKIEANWNPNVLSPIQVPPQESK